MKIELRVNGAVHELDVAPAETLLSVLRDRLDLTGTKYGCGEGQCGACTVVIDNMAVKSCQTRAALVQRRAISTIESLEQDGRLHPLQASFLKHEALQCGYCTSGMIMAGVALLHANPHPGRDDIVAAMDKNICRCGTYPRILAAISEVAHV
jgi:aerobic-type carbon monoxide dehydrogenase small subunit (CoxS/CutS family)